MEMTTTRREIVVRGFFWALLVSVSLMTAYFLITGGPVKRADKEQGQADLQQQIAQYSAALEKNPTDIRTLISLGDIYLDGENYHEAYRIFLRAEKVDPGNVHVLNDLGTIYQQMAQYDRALESYRRAYESKPEHIAPLLNMALIYSRHKGENAKALELLEKFMASNPEPQMVATAEQEIARIKQATQSGSKPAKGN